MVRPDRPAFAAAVRLLRRRAANSWAIRGYQEANAGHLAAIVAFNALVALVPTLLLVVSVAGFILHDDVALAVTIDGILAAMPASEARDALEAVLSARRNSGVIGLISLAGFFWIGTNFADALAHCLNRVHRTPDCGYVCTRRKAFAVVLGAAVLFIVAAVASAATFVVVQRTLGDAESTASAWVGQAIGYAIAFATAAALFLMLYRILPNAGQRTRDVWPGAIVAALLFVLLSQIFPLYLWIVGGMNRFGAVFGLVWLLVTWFAALGHVFLFGAYVNATTMRRRATAAARGRQAGPQVVAAGQ